MSDMSKVVVPSKYREIWRPIGTAQSLAMSCPANEILFEGTRAGGKEIANDTKVLTELGWKNAGDISLSDKLVSLDGRLTNVVGIYPHKNHKMYTIEFYDGEKIECGLPHRWLVKSGTNGNRDGWKVKTTEQLLNSKDNYSVPYLKKPLAYGKKWEGKDPYALGLLLGDGTTGSSHVTLYSVDDEILDYMTDNHNWKQYSYASNNTRRVVSPKAQDEEWLVALGGHKTAEFKSSPDGILEADTETRLAYLQGLMDTDGSYAKGATSIFTTISKQLAEDVLYLVKSLGGFGKIHVVKFNKNNAYTKRESYFSVKFSHHNQFNPFRLSRKANKYTTQSKFLTRGIKSITPSGYSDAVCFEVDHPSHCFVIGDFVVTHNTDVSLMRFRKSVGLGYGEFWTGAIIDIQYSALDDIIARAKRWFYRFDDGCKFYASKTDYKFVWRTGESLLFRAVATEDDYQSKLHGFELPFVSFNELTKHNTSDVYDAMMTVNRTSFVPEDYPLPNGTLLPKLPMCIFSTTNPSGAGKWWVKKRFVDGNERGEIVTKEIKVYNPKTQLSEIITKTQCRIFSSYKENTKLSIDYIAQLESIEDLAKKAAWTLGDWSFDDDSGRFSYAWSHEHNVMERFDIPPTWTIDRSFDWGSSHPFSVLWFATSDGCDIKLRNGKTKSTIKGDVFLIHEWYGCVEGKLNKGLHLLATDIAKGIVERELMWGIHSKVVPGNADTAIWNVENGNCIASDMMKPITIGGAVYDGVRWLRSDKKPGSRIAGWHQVCNYLTAAKPNPFRENPGLFVFKDCKYFIEIFPSLPRDSKNSDDIDTNSIDHCADAARYKIYGINTGSKSGKTQGLS